MPSIDHADQPLGWLPLSELAQSVGLRIARDELQGKGGAAVDVDASTWTRGFHEIEMKVNGLLRDARMDRDRAMAEDALNRAIIMARDEAADYALQYLTQMFIHHKQVLLAVASNRNIPERVQLLLLENAEMKQDPMIQRRLADNPSLTANVMHKLLDVASSSMVRMHVLANASKRALDYNAVGANPFAAICNKHALTNEYAVSCAATPGVNDRSVLSQLVKFDDLALGRERLRCVAGNPHTPDEVLQRLSSPRNGVARLVSTLLGGDIPAIARETLVAKQGAKQRRLAPEHGV